MRLFCFLFFFLTVRSYAINQCPVDGLSTYALADNSKDNLVHVNADKLVDSLHNIEFSGNVIIKRNKESIYAKNINYNKQKKIIKSDKKIIYANPSFVLNSNGGNYYFLDKEGEFNASEYYIKNIKAVGSAKKININHKNKVEKLNNVTYTTCSRLNSDWSLKAKEIIIDHKKDIGTAKHMTFRVRGVPIMYFPYFSFPLSNKRKSGFLMPKLDISTNNGFAITVPFYINIASNNDATIYPHFMTKRGLMIGAEYRYLLKDINGNFIFSYLNKDLKTKSKRWAIKTNHKFQWNNKLYLEALYQRVSDKNYKKDFSKSLSLSSDDFLPSNIKAKYILSKNYIVNAEVKDYQIINSKYKEKDKPYVLLPKISALGNWELGKGYKLYSDTEITNFYKKDSIYGIRFNNKFILDYLYRKSYLYIKPSVIYNFSYYKLHNKLGVKNNIIRSLPTFSVDYGMFFDRNISWFGKSITQSIEPRIYYLYTPYQNQSNIPNFDTSKIGMSYKSMFLNNRFSGRDRIGDANQLTMAVSTAITNNNSKEELARLSIGQIQYFKDRKVSLNNSVSSASRSNVFTEGKVNATDYIDINGSISINVKTKETEKSLLGITYSPSINKSFSLSHVYNKDDYKRVDFSGVWDFYDNLRFFWRWNYSMNYNKTIDAIAGLEYASCCWGVRLLARNNIIGAASSKKTNNSIYLEFILRGLVNIGNDISSTLGSVIPSYRPIIYGGNR